LSAYSTKKEKNHQKKSSNKISVNIGQLDQ
jgi:hypothetical protein